MSKIPSAEEYLSSKGLAAPKNILLKGEDVVEYMKEFAKFHVQTALNEASKKASNISHPGNRWGQSSQPIDKNSILTAYPLGNIQ